MEIWYTWLIRLITEDTLNSTAAHMAIGWYTCRDSLTPQYTSSAFTLLQPRKKGGI